LICPLRVAFASDSDQPSNRNRHGDRMTPPLPVAFE